MHLLDRFSSHLRDILARSIHLATELMNAEVQPIHLFFCLAGEQGSVAADIIRRFKIQVQSIEKAVLELPTTAGAMGKGRSLERVITPLSVSAKHALEKALVIAEQNGHNYIGSEHLLAALVRMQDTIIDDVLKVNAVSLPDLHKQIDTVFGNAAHFPHLHEVGDVVDTLQENMGPDMNATDSGAPMIDLGGRGKGRKESALDFFATHLTDRELQKNIDPVVGRDHEIERVIQILCRRTKNNPLLLGEPGVGKTAIVEGLAKRILEGTVPDMLLGKKIYALDMGLLIAGTMYRGEFEGRLRQVVDEVTHNPNIIVFIDEIHNIVGAGSNQGTMDAANLLKPALARGHIRCIGATTPAEYKKYIENDAALERRFQTVQAKEPSLEHTIEILRGIKKNYETYHAVQISDEAVVAAATLADRYIVGKFMPDKAIDLLDETAAAKRLASKMSPAKSRQVRLEEQLEKVIADKETAAQNDNFKAAVVLKKREATLRTLIQKNEERLKKQKSSPVGTVNEHDVAVQAAKIIGASPRELLLDNHAELENISTRLKEYVIGQDHVIDAVSRRIQHAKLGLSNPDRPLASFLFVGESGVGKTELAKALAKVLYASSDALIKVDMSEFAESYSTSKLLGSPAGYVGYKEHNQFTDKIKLNPYSVIVLDEIDKAHRDVVKLLLQMLENGEITDATGKKISLRHALVVMTTSYGASDMKRGTVGFGTDQSKTRDAEVKALERLKEYFSPEVIGRIDDICFFSPLGADSLVAIADLELRRFNERLSEYATSVHGDATTLAWLVEQLPAGSRGARDVRRELRSQVETLISDIILHQSIKKRYLLDHTSTALTLR